MPVGRRATDVAKVGQQKEKVNETRVFLCVELESQITLFREYVNSIHFLRASPWRVDRLDGRVTLSPLLVCCTDKVEGVEIKKLGTEIGKHMAEKSHGLFSADDWQCKT